MMGSSSIGSFVHVSIHLKRMVRCKVSYLILIQIYLLVLLQTSHLKDKMLDRLLNLQNKEQDCLIPLQMCDHQSPLHQVGQLVTLFY